MNSCPICEILCYLTDIDIITLPRFLDKRSKIGRMKHVQEFGESAILLI